MSKKQAMVYSGLDKELNTMPRVNPVTMSMDTIEKNFEKCRDSYWGDDWNRMIYVYQGDAMRRYCREIDKYQEFLTRFKNKQNVCDYWHIRADMYVSGMLLEMESFCLNEHALKYYQKGREVGDSYCTRVLEIWDEAASLAKCTDKASFRRMEYLAYEERLVPAMILLGCMYLRVGLTKKAAEVQGFMFHEGRVYCYFLDKQIKLCRKLRKDRCILAYGTMLFVVIIAVLVLLWKVFGVLKFWPFVGITALITFIYLIVESGKSKSVDSILNVLGMLLVVVGGGASENNHSPVAKSFFCCYSWQPSAWEFFIAKEFLGL